MNTLQSMKVAHVRLAVSTQCNIIPTLVHCVHLKAKQKAIHAKCGEWKIKGNPARFYTQKHVWCFESKQYISLV